MVIDHGEIIYVYSISLGLIECKKMEDFQDFQKNERFEN